MPTGRFAKDLSGQRFGRYLVKRRHGMTKGGQATFLCVCDCGNERIVTGHKLKRGESKSCGCYAAEITAERKRDHGLSKHPLFPIWDGMMGRCYRPHSRAYPGYGGRGITVCERWHDVTNFVADNEPLHKLNLSIDRIDNDGPYSPENCRWTDRRTQSLNRRSNVLLTFEGKTLTITEWAELKGIRPRTLWARVRAHGWTVEKALTTPVRQ